MDRTRFRYRLLLTVTAGLALLLGLRSAGLCAPPDILLILMDDVGVDQMTAFG